MNINNNNNPLKEGNKYSSNLKKDKRKINMAELDIEMKAKNIYKNTKNIGR